MARRRTGRAAKVAALDVFTVEFDWDVNATMRADYAVPSARVAALWFVEDLRRDGFPSLVADASMFVESQRTGRLERWTAHDGYRVAFHSCLHAGGL